VIVLMIHSVLFKYAFIVWKWIDPKLVKLALLIHCVVYYLYNKKWWEVQRSIKRIRAHLVQQTSSVHRALSRYDKVP